MVSAVLFKSEERFDSFRKILDNYDIIYTILDFESKEWIEFDYSKIDFIIYYPTFKYSSNYPLALQEVYDNLTFIHSMFPKVKMFPDPKGIKYYNDKYRQYLFLKSKKYPIPETYPLLSKKVVDEVDEKLHYPMVIKNRYGAGGGAVYRIYNKQQLQQYYKLSTLNLFNVKSLRYLFGMFMKKPFLYHLVKAKRMTYPFLSAPLLAQKYINIDRDLKTVVGNYKVIEAHWRYQAYKEQWKVNIDDGGIGVWGNVPKDAIDLSIRLAKDLQVSWINIDLIMSDGKFFITEFSPVWHHYAYKEKSSFVYKDDYNIDTPLEISLNLEKIIVESLIKN